MNRLHRILIAAALASPLGLIALGDRNLAKAQPAISVTMSTPAGRVTTCTVNDSAASGEPARAARLAAAFKATLDSGERATLQKPLSLAYAKVWSNLPVSSFRRQGVGFNALDSKQRRALMALASAALSDCGTRLLAQIRAADDVIAPIDASMGWGSGNYFVAFIGEPSPSTPWIFQISGHHVGYNVTYNGRYPSATPMFSGVEPISWTADGTTYAPLETQRAAMFALVQSLTAYPQARLKGTFTDVAMGVDDPFGPNYGAAGAPPGTRTEDNRGAGPGAPPAGAVPAGGPPSGRGGPGTGPQFRGTGFDDNYPLVYPTAAADRGVRYSELTPAQQLQVKTAIDAWVNEINSAVSSTLRAQYEGDDALADTFVAYSGAPDFQTQGSYVRIDGPRVWIEFVVQNGVAYRQAIHYHTVWRDKLADYGGEFASR